jgi:hypothetical protein
VLETELANICGEGEGSNRQNNNRSGTSNNNAIRTNLRMSHEEYAELLKELNALETQVSNNN